MKEKSPLNKHIAIITLSLLILFSSLPLQSHTAYLSSTQLEEINDSVYAIKNTLNYASEALSTPVPRENLLNKEDVFSPKLKEYLEGSSPKDVGIPVRPSGDILVALISEKKPEKWVVPPAPFGKNWFSIISISNKSDLLESAYQAEALRMFELSRVPRDTFLDNNTGLLLDSDSYINALDPLENMGAKQVWEKFGYTGEGVTVGIVDSGVDFGNSDLSSRLHRLDDGTPSVFDPSGAGIVLTPVTIRPVTEEGLELLKLSEIGDFPIWTGEQLSLINASQLGIKLEDLDITSLKVKSVSGDYKFGIGVEPSGAYIQIMISVLVDSKTPHVYDTLFIDMDTSLGLSLVLSGIIFDGSKTYRQLVDWTLNDDSPFVFRENDILAKDSNGDGANDISFGTLGNTLDIYGVLNGKMVSGILEDGSGYAVMYDYVGHGTSAAACIASSGKAQYPIFDNKETEIIENYTLYKLYGTAPNASIVATKFYSLADIFNAWYWTMGLEPDFELGTWVYNKQHHSDIISNSFGVSDLDVVGTIRGLDPFSLFIDYASVPHLVHPLYPGSIFVIASGNGGPGVGTSATPGIAGSAITIGATSFKQYLEFEEKTVQSTTQMAMFSSRGPSPLFISKPDFSAVGEYWDAPAPVITGEGNGTYAFQLFGGTSQATPYAAGITALVVQALKDKNADVSLAKVKQFLILGATDLALPSQLQGAGEVNATKSVLLALSRSDLPVITDGTRDYGVRTNEAFKALFGISNPLLSMNDTYVPTFLGYDGNDTISLNFQGINSVDLLTTAIEENTTLEGKTYGRAVAYRQLLTTFDYPPDIDGIRFQFSFSSDAWNTILNSGTEKPFTIAIIDWIDKNNNGVIDAPENTTYPLGERVFLIEYKMLGQKTILDLSLKTYTPKGTLTLVVFDPDGDPQNILASRNFNYKVKIYWLREVTPKVETKFASPNNLEISLNQSSVFLGKLKINTDNDSYVLPISIVKTVKQPVNGSYSLPYLNDSINGPSYVFGTPNYLGRPDQGETYYLSFFVPQGADLIPIIVNWDDPTATVDVYLAKENGTIVKTSDIKYFGGGMFDSLKTEPDQQRLIYNRENPEINETMLLVLHVTTPPISKDYTKVNAIVRILNKKQLGEPETTFEPSNTKVSGELKIITPKKTYQNFPELELEKVTVGLQNKNITTFSKDIPNVDPSNNTIDYVLSLKLFAGTATRITISSEEASGVLSVMIIWWESTISSENDLLLGYGMQESNEVNINYLPDKTGEYLLVIDVSNTTILNDYTIKVEIDTTTQLTLPLNTVNGTIHTDRLPDGNYSLLLTYYTNFEGLKFQEVFQKYFLNPREIIISDYSTEKTTVSPGESVTISLKTSYTGSLSLFVVAVLQGNNKSVLPSVFLGNLKYASKISVPIPKSVPPGDYLLKLSVTDGIASYTIVIALKIEQNIIQSVTSTLYFNVLPVITIFFVMGLILRNKRTKKSKALRQ